MLLRLRHRLGDGAAQFEARRKTAQLAILLSIVLSPICCRSASAQTKPIVSVDLRTAGLPQDAFVRKNYKQCPHQYFGYRSVEWLDANRVLLAFNTGPDCAATEGLRDDSLRLATFDVQGKKLHSADVACHAGDGGALPIISHGGIWIGPDQTVIVEVPSPHLKALPDSHDRLLAFSDDLVQIQEIDIGDHDRIGDGMHFSAVSQDRRHVLFSAPGEPTKTRPCVAYSKFPITNPEACSPEDLASINPRPNIEAVPKGYEYRAFPGASTDGRRSSLFAVKEENASCELAGKLCRSKGRVVVFETSTRQTLLKMDIPLNGRAALSPDGTRLAVLQQNSLQIFAVP